MSRAIVSLLVVLGCGVGVILAASPAATSQQPAASSACAANPMEEAAATLQLADVAILGGCRDERGNCLPEGTPCGVARDVLLFDPGEMPPPTGVCRSRAPERGGPGSSRFCYCDQQDVL